MFNVNENFNSRFSALERRYAYVIYNTKKKPLFFDKFSYWVTNELDINDMKDQLNMFLGEHNFNSFRSSSCNSNNSVKKVSYVDIQRSNNFIIVTVVANAFLQNMVRIMVGTIIDIAKKENDLSITEILKKEDRKFAGKTAPPNGLFFLGPSYPDHFRINSLDLDLFNRLGI